MIFDGEEAFDQEDYFDSDLKIQALLCADSFPIGTEPSTC